MDCNKLIYVKEQGGKPKGGKPINSSVFVLRANLGSFLFKIFD